MTDDDVKTIEEDDRAQFVAAATSRGAARADAEDAAHDAIVAVLAKKPENANQYGRKVARNRVARQRRDQSRGRARGHTAPPDAPDIPVSLAWGADVANLAGALEQVVGWGTLDPGGRTFTVVGSVSDVDEKTVADELRFYLDVIERVAASERHRRRLKARFFKLIRSAMTNSGYRYRDTATPPVRIVEPAEEEAVCHEDDTEDADEDRTRGEARLVWVRVIADGFMSRALSLLDSLRVNIPYDEKLKIARDARTAMLRADAADSDD